MTYRDMSEMTRITYLRSDIVVSTTIYDAATRFLCTQLQPGMDDDAVGAVMEKSIKMALDLAVRTEKAMNT